MKTPTHHRVAILLALALTAWLNGCGRHPAETSASHEGHAHALTAPPGDAPAAAADRRCPEHNVRLAECGICRPEALAGLKPGEAMKIRLAAPNSAQRAGVETAAPELGTLAESVECYAEISFDQNRLAQIAAPVGGIIHEVTVDLGGKVEEKQTVARIWSAAIAEALAKAVLTHQTLDRERRLRAERVTSEKDLQEAEAAHRTACQQLRTLGFTEAQVEVLNGQPQESVLLEVRAPFAGEIVERSAVRGALVDAGKALFTIADRSSMWAMLNIPESALARIRVGQPVELRVDALPDRRFTGTLTWIGAEVDERSRTARARAEVPNPEGLLRAKMFAQARILVRASANALLLPAAAIQSVEGQPFLFVQRADDLFEARAVRLGTRADGRQEILAGVDLGERIVVQHSFVLKSQLLISRLGAGCADD